MNFDSQIESQIAEITNRIVDIESEFFSIAGARLSKIYEKPPEQLKGFLYSADFLDSVNADLKKIRRLLEKTHKDNLNAIKLLANGIAMETRIESIQLAGEDNG
ncbi:MAG: hypothetical protein FWF29_11680 [Treponema sp.]|nr:hypothetical protein [Treponema sp.]